MTDFIKFQDLCRKPCLNVAMSRSATPIGGANGQHSASGTYHSMLVIVIPVQAVVDLPTPRKVNIHLNLCIYLNVKGRPPAIHQACSKEARQQLQTWGNVSKTSKLLIKRERRLYPRPANDIQVGAERIHLRNCKPVDILLIGLRTS